MDSKIEKREGKRGFSPQGGPTRDPGGDLGAILTDFEIIWGLFGIDFGAIGGLFSIYFPALAVEPSARRAEARP